MKKIKAYTLMEMLVVMTILIIVLSIGLYSYVAYVETTKYNQDVANLQNDIRTMQRASMLFKKDADDGWVYGVGIDFDGVIKGEGTYQFFKWCSGFEEYGDPKTTGKYPNYDEILGSSGITVASVIPYEKKCGDLPQGQDGVASLSGYGSGKLNLEEDVVMGYVNPEDDNPLIVRFLLFESVTGRAFFFDKDGIFLENHTAKIYFDKRIGTKNVLKIDTLTGKGTVMGMSDVEIGEMEDIIDDREPLPPAPPEPDPEEPEPDPEEPIEVPIDDGPYYPYPDEGECVKPGDCYYIDPVYPPSE